MKDSDSHYYKLLGLKGVHGPDLRLELNAVFLLYFIVIRGLKMLGVCWNFVVGHLNSLF